MLSDFYDGCLTLKGILFHFHPRQLLYLNIDIVKQLACYIDRGERLRAICNPATIPFQPILFEVDLK